MRDQIPYLLDLADGVTRMINDETRSRRMPAFGMRPPNTSKCEIVIFKEIGRLKTSVDTLPMSGGQGVAVVDRLRLAEDRVRPEVSQWC